MKRGLVIGKFYPLHNGHSYLINTATAHSDQVDVLICDSLGYTIPASVRKQWIQAIHPDVTVHIIPDLNNDDDSKAWAEHTIAFLGYSPDIVFSSEDYGFAYAHYMGAEHHLVDRARTHVPIAASKIRPDVLKSWDYLNPIVRQTYARRICILGAESTGTTTLTRALAEQYHAPWAPEYGRTYTEALTEADHDWQSDEFNFIAEQQQQLEDQLAGQSHGIVFCDTNAFATRLWHERYMGTMSDALNTLTSTCHADLYIVTCPDIPFEQDGIRDGEHIRYAMHDRFIQELHKAHLPFIIARGTPSERLATANRAIDRLVQQEVTI